MCEFRMSEQFRPILETYEVPVPGDKDHEVSTLLVTKLNLKFGYYELAVST